jgi:hypothetical protein
MTKIQQINSAVVEAAQRHNLNLANNDDYNLAFAAARRANPVLFATNDTLKGVEASSDGTQLNPGWPAPPERLKKLGLPLNTTEDAYRLFSLADETKLSPEIAAVVVRTLVQFSQIERSLSFDEAMVHIGKYRPELYRFALEAARNRPTTK